MSIIGRLDKQVDEILISPLDRNRQRAPEAQQPADAATPEEAQPSNHAHENPPPRNEKDELPVWLL